MATANPSTTTDDRRWPDGSLGGRLAERRDHPLTNALQAVAFWAAVVLPFLALALAAWPGVDAATLSALLAGNALAVVGGHGYDA